MVDGVSSSPAYLTDPVAPDSDGPRSLESNRDLSSSDTTENRNQEVAMGAVVFRDLQRGGLIDKDAKLADRPPADGSAAGLKGTSYEARLTELVTDQDKNGKLDLDLDRLSNSGMLTRKASPAELERTLSGRQDDLSDSFIRSQSSKSGLSMFGVKNQRGQAVQDSSKGLVLSGNQDRQTEAFVDQVGPRVANDPESSKKVADEAIMGAQVLTKRGDQRNAQTLLSGTASKLQDARKFDDSARVWRELKTPPYKDTPVNLVQDEIDQVKVADPSYKDGDEIRSEEDGNTNRVAPNQFKSTYGAIADRGLAQIDMSKRMSKALGRPASPENVDDARDYFTAYAKGKSTDQVRTEYDGYLKNSYVHAGDGVDWDPAVAPKDRPEQLQSLLSKQPETADGRRIVDCEGFSYLTGHVLGGVTNPDGSKRFDVVYVGTSDHLITGVFDRNARNAGFSVNNATTAPLSGPLDTPEARGDALAKTMNGSAYNVVAFGSDPSGAEVFDAQHHLRTGTVLYDGSELAGVVTPQISAAFDRARSQRLYLSPSQFVGLIDQGKITP
jgi:hypothetical protein